MTELDPEELIQRLGLRPHPEGGHYRETYRASFEVPAHGGMRAASTAIYFLLRAGEYSAFHRVHSDEVWHHYSGASLELHTLSEGIHQKVRLGPRETPQWVVRAGVWQAARAGDGAVLCGCTVAPGFDFADFEMAEREGLRAAFPAHSDVVEALTRL